MPDNDQKGHQLEQVLYKLLDYQSGQGADQKDTMLMLSLLNLYGIVSVMNKHYTKGVEQQGAMDSMLGMLQSMMSGQNGPDAGGKQAGGKQEGSDPLLGMLQSMMSGQNAPGPRGQQGGADPLMNMLMQSLMPGANGPGGPGQQGGLDPMMLLLMSMLSGQFSPQPDQEGKAPGGQSGPPINQALLMSLLANMMSGSPPGAPQPRGERPSREPGQECQPELQRAPAAEKKSVAAPIEPPVQEVNVNQETAPVEVEAGQQKEFRRGPREILKWDPRLKGQL